MGSFSTDVSQQQAVKLISSWCRQKRLRIVSQVSEQFGGATRRSVKARPVSNRIISTINWRLSTKNGDTIVHITVKPNMILSFLALFLFSAGVGLVFCPLLFHFDLSIEAYLCLFSVGFVLLLLFLFFLNWFVRRQADYEIAFWRLLKRKQVIEGIGATFAPRWSVALLVFGLFGVLFFLIYKSEAVVLGLLALVGFLYFAILLVIDVSTKDPFSKWKILIATLAKDWVVICLLAWTPLGALAVLNGKKIVGAQRPDVFKDKVSVVLQETVRTAFSTEAFRRNSTALEEENLKIFKQSLANSIEVLQGKRPSTKAIIDKGLPVFSSVLLFLVVLSSCVFF